MLSSGKTVVNLENNSNLIASNNSNSNNENEVADVPERLSDGTTDPSDDGNFSTKEEKEKTQDGTEQPYEYALHAQCTPFQKTLTSFVAGGIAGAIAKSTIAPLDRTKIHFQISDRSYSFKRAVTFLFKSAQQDGLRSLWRGNSATVARIVPYAGVQFASHEWWKEVIGAQTQTSTPGKRYIAGCLAGSSAVTLTYPLDLARARMAVSNRCQYRSIFSVFRKVAVEEGVRSLYRGFLPTMVGIIPYAGTSFFVYETLKKNHYADPDRVGDPAPFRRVLFGACAGLTGQAVTYPLDIVRRRMQTAPLKDRTVEYRSIWSTVVFLYRMEGRRGFYKGLSMNFIKGPIATGISFSTNDVIKTKLRALWVDC